jgi:hypothetical protein
MPATCTADDPYPIHDVDNGVGVRAVTGPEILAVQVADIRVAGIAVRLLGVPPSSRKLVLIDLHEVDGVVVIAFAGRAPSRRPSDRRHRTVSLSFVFADAVVPIAVTTGARRWTWAVGIARGAHGALIAQLTLMRTSRPAMTVRQLLDVPKLATSG